MHPDGYHKDEDARERCYACSNPDMLKVSAADRAKGQQLVADGWVQISRRYRHVARVTVPYEDFHDVVAAASGSDGSVWLDYEDRNGAFMSAANPAVVIELIETLRVALAQAAGWERRAEFAAEQYRRRNKEAQAHESALEAIRSRGNATAADAIDMQMLAAEALFPGKFPTPERLLVELRRTPR